MYPLKVNPLVSQFPMGSHASSTIMSFVGKNSVKVRVTRPFNGVSHFASSVWIVGLVVKSISRRVESTYVVVHVRQSCDIETIVVRPLLVVCDSAVV